MESHQGQYLYEGDYVLANKSRRQTSLDSSSMNVGDGKSPEGETENDLLLMRLAAGALNSLYNYLSSHYIDVGLSQQRVGSRQQREAGPWLSCEHQTKISGDPHALQKEVASESFQPREEQRGYYL